MNTFETPEIQLIATGSLYSLMYSNELPVDPMATDQYAENSLGALSLT